ncbi:porin OmpA [Haemophilus parahaemolyticus]
MQKSLIALSVLTASAVVTAAPQADTFYVGAKAGWANFRGDLTQFDVKYGGAYSINKNTLTTGIFGGYQILNQDNFGLATELGYDYFGRVRGNAAITHGARHIAHGLNLGFKPSYSVSPDLDVYGKVGVALIRNDYKRYTPAPTRKAHILKPSLALAAGVEYVITPELAARVEYQYVNKVGNLQKAVRKTVASSSALATSYSPDLHSVTVGLSYRFGQGPVPVEPVAPAAAPEIVTKNFSFSSDVLFAFGKADLKPEAAQALDGANNEINTLGLANPSIQVNGHADRIGKPEANIKLSQRRAETVANYLVSKGQNPANVAAVGYGSAQPVTGNTCDAVKGRQALIACLAPDRRVEVQIKGSKEVTM